MAVKITKRLEKNPNRIISSLNVCNGGERGSESSGRGVRDVEVSETGSVCRAGGISPGPSAQRGCCQGRMCCLLLPCQGSAEDPQLSH